MPSATRTAVDVGARLLRATAALTLLLGIIVGVPWLLTTFIGWPLPDHVPSRDEIVTFLDGPITDQVILNVLGCACWIAWAAFTAETAAATVTAVTDLRRGHPPGRPSGHPRDHAQWRRGGLTAGAPAGGFPAADAAAHQRAMGHLAAGLVGAILLALIPPRQGADLHLTTTIAATETLQPSDQPRTAAANSDASRSRPQVGYRASPIDARDLPPERHRSGRYVTVRPPHGHRHDSLWRIAERELGDPRRWLEIYRLNAGQPQPGGGTLEDPDMIHPGWILHLPDTDKPAGSAKPRASQRHEPDRADSQADSEADSQADSQADTGTRSGASSSPNPDQGSPRDTPAPTNQAPAAPSPTPSPTAAPTTPTPKPTPTPTQAASNGATTSTSSPASSPPSSAGGKPASVPRPTAPSTSTGIDLTTGGYVGLALAAAVSALLGMARLRRRRRDTLTELATFRLPLEPAAGEPPPAVVQALRRAHLDVAHDQTAADAADTISADTTSADTIRVDAISGDQGGPIDPNVIGTDVATGRGGSRAPDPEPAVPVAPRDPDAWAVRTSMGRRRPDQGLWVAVGTTRDGREIGLDLATCGGIGLDGPGTLSVARSLIATLVSDADPGQPAPSAHLVIPRIDLERLLGPHATQPPPPHITITDDADAALELLTAREPRQPRVLVVTPSAAVRARLSEIFTHRPVRPNTAAIVLRPWPGQGNLTISDDGRVATAGSAATDSSTGPALTELAGGRAYHLSEAELAGILHLARDASASAEEPEAGSTDHDSDSDHNGDDHGEESEAPEEASHAPALAPQVYPGSVGPSSDPALTGSQAQPDESRPDETRDVVQARNVQELEAAAPEPSSLTTGEGEGLAGEDEAGEEQGGEDQADEDQADEDEVGRLAVPAMAEWVEAAHTGAGRWEPPVIVQVLGAPRLLVNGQSLRHGLRGKTQELLMYLVLHPVGVTPDALTEALWPAEPASRGALRSAIKRLRNAPRQGTALGDQAFVLYSDGRYRPDRRVIGCDAWQFEAAIERARHAPHDAERATALAEATGLIHGQLLDGTDYAWVDAYRQTLRRHALQAFVRYAAALEAEDPEAALAALERALAIDAYNESLYRRVMRLQARLGRPEAVAGTLELLRRQLADIGQTPERQTDALAASVERSEATAASAAAGRGSR